MSGPRRSVHADPAALATAVAGALLERIAAVQADGREPHVALTGGTVADLIHREAARLSPGSPVDWRRVHLWWGDERFVAPDDEDRNALQARRALLDVVGTDPANVHEMPSTADAADVAAGAAAYAAELRAQGAGEFDVVMLGVGPDGHVASLFPGFPQVDAVDVTVGVTGSPKPPPERISLTLPALNRARAVWFVVTGAAKAPAVARALGADSEAGPLPTDEAGLAPVDGAGLAPVDVHDLPAAGVSGREETVWHLDREAASPR